MQGPFACDCPRDTAIVCSALIFELIQLVLLKGMVFPYDVALDLQGSHADNDLSTNMGKQAERSALALLLLIQNEIVF